MRTLLIAAQDIRFVDFALVEDGRVAREAHADVGPERYLEALDGALKGWGIAPTDLAAVAVVTGPGAFTSSRVSTVIANGFAFAAALPVIAVENPKRLPLADLAASLPSSAGSYAVPVYDRPPNITVKK